MCVSVQMAWLTFVGLCLPVTLIPYLLWKRTVSRYVGLASGALPASKPKKN